MYNNRLYGAGGTSLLEWNGSNAWVEVAPAPGGAHLVVYNDKLYSASGPLYQWNDINAWVQIAPTSGTAIQSLVVYNNKLYGSSGISMKLWEFDDVNAWVEVAPRYLTETHGRSLAVYNGELYCSTLPRGYLIKWNGTNAWVQAADRAVAAPGANGIDKLLIFDSKIYGGGAISAFLYEYDDVSAWVSVANPPGGGYQFVRAMVELNNELYAGMSVHPGAGEKLWKWNGTNAWVEAADNISIQHGIGSLAIYSNTIFGGTHRHGDDGGHLYRFSEVAPGKGQVMRIQFI